MKQQGLIFQTHYIKHKTGSTKFVLLCQVESFLFIVYTYICTSMQNFMLFRSRAVSLPDERRKINEKYDLAGNSVELQLKCVQVKAFINGSCKRDHCCRHMIHDPSLFYPGLDQISGKPLSYLMQAIVLSFSSCSRLTLKIFCK